MKHSDIFYNLSFFNSSKLGSEIKIFFCSFWLIFLQIRIQEAKILRIQRIRILSTDLKDKQLTLIELVSNAA